MKRAFWVAGLVGAGAAAAALAVACRSDDCNETATCAAAASITPGAAPDGPKVYPEVPPPAGCDPTVDARDAPKCIDDVYALFVDLANGDDAAGLGTQAKPYKTFAVATNVDRLAGRPRIYVCNGTDPPVTEPLFPPPNVSVFAGFTCPAWAYEGTKTTVNAPKSFALHVSDSPKGVYFSDFAFLTADTAELGASSLAVFVADSAVTFRRVIMKAGNAGRGADAAKFDTNGGSGPVVGNDGGATGGLARSCTCPYGTSRGGKGGDPSNGGGEVGSADPPATMGVGRTGAPGTSGASCPGTLGGDGAARDGGAGFPKLGTLSHDGWKPGDGLPGFAGNPGQGGGGGAATSSLGGGGGGCGGCGGAGGLGGGAGGSSIALLAYHSDVHLEGCTLTGAKGGKGGAGGKAEPGFVGGAGGAPSSGNCKGAGGGKGAGGSGGGGGAGGYGIAVLRLGGAFTFDGSSALNHGVGDIGGNGGGAGEAASDSNGGGNPGLPGAPGIYDALAPALVELTE